MTTRLAAMLCACTALVACASDEGRQPAPVYNAMLETHDRSIGAHMVSPGESLENIAKNYKITIDDILLANNIASPNQVGTGQRLFLPDRATLSGMSDVSLATPQRGESYIAKASGEPSQDTAPAMPSMADQPVVANASVTQEPLAPMAPPSNGAALQTAELQPAPTTPAPVQPQAVIEPVKLASNIPPDQWRDPLTTGFRWPVRGPTLSDFGAKAGGLKNDGVNIGASMGAPVEAAADGEVVYTGQAVEGFGNLVLLKHKNNLVTAYGHLSRIDVAKGQTVSAGNIIGGVGQSGSVSAPQLHFQVRKGTEILNPMQYLKSPGTLTAGI